LAAAVVALGICAWATGIVFKGYDYDEIYHAHVVWLISQGAVPFTDFFASHPPFAWYPLVPFAWWCPESWLLTALRLISSLGVLVWVGMLLANAGLDRNGGSNALAIAWVSPVLFHPAVLDFALEIRPDAWCYALLFAALWVVRRRVPASLVARYALFGFLTSLAVAATPKFVVLPVAFAIFDLARIWADKQSITRVLAGYLVGGLAAGLSMWGFCRLVSIEPRLAFAWE
jgi:hypothetical protein